MADEMKELRGAVFDLIPDGVSVVALDEIEVDDMAPKTRNVKDEDSNKQHRVDDERFGGLVYKLPGVAVRDCRRKRIRDKVSVFRPAASLRRDPGDDPAPTHWPRAALPLRRGRPGIHHRRRRRGVCVRWHQHRKALQ